MDSPGDLSIFRHRLFLYGTLKKGQPNYHHMSKPSHNGSYQYLGQGITEERFPLVIGPFLNIPMLLQAPGQGQKVSGEVYAVDDKFLEWSDKFECHPTWYTREPVLVEVASNSAVSSVPGEPLECFAYFIQTFPPVWLQEQTYSSYDAFGSHGRSIKPASIFLTADSVNMTEIDLAKSIASEFWRRVKVTYGEDGWIGHVGRKNF